MIGGPVALIAAALMASAALLVGSGNQLPVGREDSQPGHEDLISEPASPATVERVAARRAPLPGLVFEDKFSGTSLDRSRWSTCHWWAPKGCTIASNNELEWYLASQSRVREGTLRLVAESARPGQAPKGLPFVSGMVSTGPQEVRGRPKFAFRYGKVEVRFRLPRGTGLWPAIWMLPASTKSRPEIDLLEVLGHQPNTARLHFHPEDRSRPSPARYVEIPRLSQDWHTVSLAWRPGELTWFIDGQRVWRITGGQVPDEPMYLVMNLAVGGDRAGPPDSSKRLSATMLVDWVRVYK